MSPYESICCKAMRQQTLAERGFKEHRKRMRRGGLPRGDEPGCTMRQLCDVIKPRYPCPQGSSRCPPGLERL